MPPYCHPQTTEASSLIEIGSVSCKTIIESEYQRRRSDCAESAQSDLRFCCSRAKNPVFSRRGPYTIINMSHKLENHCPRHEKPRIFVQNQVKLKATCPATETNWSKFDEFDVITLSLFALYCSHMQSTRVT